MRVIPNQIMHMEEVEEVVERCLLLVETFSPLTGVRFWQMEGTVQGSRLALAVVEVFVWFVMH